MTRLGEVVDEERGRGVADDDGGKGVDDEEGKRRAMARLGEARREEEGWLKRRKKEGRESPIAIGDYNSFIYLFIFLINKMEGGRPMIKIK